MRRKLFSLILLILILGLVGCSNVHIGGHDYGQWQVVKEATCTEDGLQERVCSCGSKETEVIPALGHNIVVDEAKAATCTKNGATEGSHCSRCKLVLQQQQVIPASHVEELLPAIAPTCTRAGKEEGFRCTVCGETVVRQKKIRAEGHNYVNGVCTKCGKNQPDMAVAIVIDQLNESGQPNFFTKQAYPAGSTLTFQAYVPSGTSWWAVSWTKNPSDTSLYSWAEGQGVRMDIQAGKWQYCTVKLPDDGGNYYFYIVGAKGEWGGKALLIDDVTITNPAGDVLGTDRFTTGVSDGLFNATQVNPTNGNAVVYAEEVCTGHWSVKDEAVAATCEQAGKTEGAHCGNCGKILTAQEEIPAAGHQWEGEVCSVCGKKKENLAAAIVIDQLNESAPMNFITKQPYAGGSTVSFKAYVPYGVAWWAVSWTTDPMDADLYKWSQNAGAFGQQMESVNGQWTSYSVTLPEGGPYYLYFVGEKGKWNHKELQIDDVTITGSDNTLIAQESFDNGVQNSIFQVIVQNPTNFSVVVSDKVMDDPCKDGHTIVIDPAVEPTCTEAGMTEGKHCSVCGLVLQAQEQVPAKGHTYDENGKCECGAELENRAVAINIDYLSDNEGSMSFITRAAYGGGSTVSLRAFVPEGTAWWGICWTTDPADTGLYRWLSGEGGHGTTMNSSYGIWKEYSVTLPEGDEAYYFYIVGAKGEWNGKELLIDDVVVTNRLGETVVKDNFDNGMHSGIFKITDHDSSERVVVREIVVEECLHTHKTQEPNLEPTCTEDGYLGATVCDDCGAVINGRTPLPATGHQWVNGECSVCHEHQTVENHAAAIYIDNLTEEAPMSFISANAYPGGSTVTFRAYVPSGASWWAVCWTTDPSNTDLYKWTGGEAYGKSMSSVPGQWAEYSVTLPDDSNNYYIYFVGAKGEWNGNALLIDDVTITPAGGTAITEDFEKGFDDCLFHVVKTHGTNTVVEWKTIENGSQEEPTENHVAAIYINNLTEETASFITKEAYAGGSTVSFKAYVPTGATWWAVSWTTDPSNTDLYKWTGGEAYGKSMSSVPGQWAEYSVTLPDDSNNYYIYIVGAKGEWKDSEGNALALLIDDVTITPAGGTAITEDFEKGFDDCLFHVVKTHGTNTVVEWKTIENGSQEEPTENHVAAIYINNLTEETASFITKEAYAGGSTVSFEAYVPTGASWWAVCWTTDPADVGLYTWTGGEAYGKSMSSVPGQWAEYSVTLPNNGNSYYIYFVGAKGEWNGNALLIDDVTITPAGGTAITEDFEKGLDDCLFDVVKIHGANTIVEWKCKES